MLKDKTQRQQYRISATAPEQHINHHIIDDVIIDSKHVFTLKGLLTSPLLMSNVSYFVNEPREIFVRDVNNPLKVTHMLAINNSVVYV